MSAPREEGFTLIEMLIAVFIMSLIGVMGATMLNGTLSTRERTEATIAAAEELDLARAVIVRDLSQLAPRRTRDPFGIQSDSSFEAGTRFNEGRLMAFLTTGRAMIGPRAGRSRLEFVEYLFQDGELIRRGWHQVDRAPDSTYTDRVLLRGLTDLDISFYFNGRWNDVSFGTSAASGPPEAVELTLDHPRHGEIAMRFLTQAGL